MVRATYAAVLMRLGGTYPTGWAEAQVTNLCTRADYILNGYTSPTTLSTTDASRIEVAIDIVLRLMRIADMMQTAGGSISSMGRAYVDMPVLSDELKSRIDILKDAAVTYPYVTNVDLVED